MEGRTKMKKQNQTWFDVDRAGLAKILKRKGVEFAVFELIQNAWDEAGVTRVEVTLEPARKGVAHLSVQDDAPEGFKDLRHAYTLFAESEKKANAEQRGRFNIGEKLVLSLCEHAVVTTTKGSVVFDENGRHETGFKREYGTKFAALIRMSKLEIEQVTREVHKLIPPLGTETVFNGTPLQRRETAHVIEASMPTEIADAEGYLRKATRKTEVRCYKPIDGEVPMIYEMGIPVVEHDCAFHCDVQQKVQLTIDRDNVTPWFLKALRTVVFNHTHKELTTEDVNHEWAQTAIESGHAEPEAVQDYMSKRFGELRASYDPTDREANSRAVANGYTIVHGSMLTKDAWNNVRAVEAVIPAGRLFPTSPDSFVPTEFIEPDERLSAIAAYADRLGLLLMGFAPAVRFTTQKSNELATYSQKTITFNVTNLGADWFDLETNRLEIDHLIIHEFGHEYEANHLSEAYNDALTRLAAKAMQLGREGRLP